MNGRVTISFPLAKLQNPIGERHMGTRTHVTGIADARPNTWISDKIFLVQLFVLKIPTSYLKCLKLVVFQCQPEEEAGGESERSWPAV